MPDTFVLDCSIAAKWVLPEPDRAPALGWFDRCASGRSSADRSRYSSGGIRQSGSEASPPETDLGGASSCGLLLDGEMRASPIRHAPAALPRPRTVFALPVVPMGLRLPRPRPGTPLSAPHRRPPPLPGRQGTPSFPPPAAITDPLQPRPPTRHRPALKRLRWRNRPERRIWGSFRVGDRPAIGCRSVVDVGKQSQRTTTFLEPDNAAHTGGALLRASSKGQVVSSMFDGPLHPTDDD